MKKKWTVLLLSVCLLLGLTFSDAHAESNPLLSIFEGVETDVTGGYWIRYSIRALNTDNSITGGDSVITKDSSGSRLITKTWTWIDIRFKEPSPLLGATVDYPEFVPIAQLKVVLWSSSIGTVKSIKYTYSFLNLKKKLEK